MKIVTVHATTSYCVCIGKGLLQQAGKEIKKIIQQCANRERKAQKKKKQKKKK